MHKAPNKAVNPEVLGLVHTQWGAMKYASVSFSSMYYQEKTHKAASYLTFILHLVARLCWMFV